MSTQPRTGSWARSRSGNTPRGVAAGYGAVWVAVGGTSDERGSGSRFPARRCRRRPTRVDVWAALLRRRPAGAGSRDRLGSPSAWWCVGVRRLDAGRDQTRSPRPWLPRGPPHRRLPVVRRLDGAVRRSVRTSTSARRTPRPTARTPRVVGVIGPQDSPCAFVQIPIANRAPDGPLAMISPSNSYPGLTRAAPFVPAGQLDELYPTGTRNYVRIFPADHAQAAALAVLADELALELRLPAPRRPRVRPGDGDHVSQGGRLASGSRSRVPAGGIPTPKAMAISPVESVSPARRAFSSPGLPSRIRGRCSRTSEQDSPTGLC